MPETIDGYDGNSETKSICYYGADQRGNSLYVELKRYPANRSELTLLLSSDEDVYELAEHPNTVITQHRDEEWSAQGLTLRVLEKDRRARIRFNGLLRKGTRNSVKEDIHTHGLEHVRLNFIFVASSKARWANGRRWLDNKSPLDKARIDQYGSMSGLVRLGNNESREMFLRGLRRFFAGKSSRSAAAAAVSRWTLIGLDEIGNSFCCYSKSSASLRKNKLGHVKDPLENVTYIDSNEMDINEFKRQLAPEDKLEAVKFKFKTTMLYDKIQLSKKYEVQIALMRPTMKRLYGGFPWAYQTTYWACKLNVNGAMGHGLVQLTEPYLGECPLARLPSPNGWSWLEPPERPEGVDEKSYNEVALLWLGNPRCKDEKLCGGDVASLAQLIQLRSTQFEVPAGFCVTTYAFECFLRHNTRLLAAIDELIDSYKTGPPTIIEPFNYCTKWRERRVAEPDITQHLKKIADLFETATMPPNVESQIRKSLSRPQEVPDVGWILQLSAHYKEPLRLFSYGNHGARDIRSADDVIREVIRLWGLVYGRSHVEYRHSAGLPLKSPMAVFVRKRVAFHAIGAMYTRQPDSGDPRVITVETRESRQWFDFRRGVDDSLSLSNSGSLYTPERVAAGSTAEQRPRERWSIDPGVALRIAELGLELDKLYDEARDIEWAWTRRPQDKIHLLQCQPAEWLVDDDWTDFELSHELGSGVPADKDLLTFAQADEMFPRCLTPLTCTAVVDKLVPSTFVLDDDDDEDDVDKVDDSNDRVKTNPLFIANMRVAFNYYDFAMRNCEVTNMKDMMLKDLGLCGRVIVTKELIEAAMRRRYGLVDRSSIVRHLDQTKLERGVERDEREICALKIGQLETKLVETRVKTVKCDQKFDDLDKNEERLKKMSRYHGFFSRVCSQKVMEIMRLLSSSDKPSGAFTAQNFADASLLLAKGRRVPTAQVPRVLTRVSEEIWKKIRLKQRRRELVDANFGKMDVSKVDTWLKTDVKAQSAFSHIINFMNKDGNLGHNEFELAEEPFILRLDRFYTLLQYYHVVLKQPSRNDGMVYYCNFRSRYNCIPGPPSEELLQSISTPIDPETRERIAELLPRAQQAVEQREFARLLLSKTTHRARTFYRSKAIELVNAGKLPDENLINYLTSWEVLELLEATCCPRLVRKAQMRRLLWARLDEARYPLTSYGMPRAQIVDDFDEAKVRRADYSTRGVPINAGVMCNRVFVAERFEDDLQQRGLRPWDVLVVAYVDAGWSQYFPMLSGIIAERGSLFSPGAAMVRDFNVPCIMGVTDATRIFRTGDGVHMDGSTGEIRRESDRKNYTFPDSIGLIKFLRSDQVR
ncbi:hypothetical protein TKK_0003073 [Trichogramma kaykai]